MTRTFTLLAPLSGWLVSLDQVPDPVFAGRIVGDGVSIDPVSDTVLAPCEGRIAQIHASGHAVSIRRADGLDVLLHVGIDTVKLRGDGFEGLVRVGDTVAAGHPLIRFDVDRVAQAARSLLTQVLVTPADRVLTLVSRSGRVRAGIDVVLEVSSRAPISPEGDPVGATAEVRLGPITVRAEGGLHARPAASLAQACKRFDAQVKLLLGSAEANARSVVDVLALEVEEGVSVHVVARGPDAAAAAQEIARLLGNTFGSAPTHPPMRSRRDTARNAAIPVPPAAAPSDAVVAPGASAPAADIPPPPNPESPEPGDVLQGVAAAPGLVVGQVFRFVHEARDVPERGDEPHVERRRLDEALERARGQLESLRERTAAQADADQSAIFVAHGELLDDPALRELADAGISTGRSAAASWRDAVSHQSDRLSRLSSGLMAARAADLRDVGRRVLDLVLGEQARSPEIPPGSILVAEELTPSDTASLDRDRVVGFCSTGGGATSHSAILARSLGLVAVAAMDPRVLRVPTGVQVILDGDRGLLVLRPDAQEVERVVKSQATLRARRKREQGSAAQPAVTKDGERVVVLANIGGPRQAPDAVRAGAEGVGLLRSEFLFLDRSTAPTEDEQFEALLSIVTTLGPDRPLVVRALDVGGDKPLSYLQMPPEANPFLGERGIRLLLARPDLMREQVRAVFRASAHGPVHLMLPMVGTMDEWRQARSLIEEERTRLGASPIPVGMMVEVPSAALMARVFAREADFFSIGTNDLTQYTLAMDRGHPLLAAKVDGLHPSVLRLIHESAQAARSFQRHACVCGGLAGDAAAIPILVGLGVHELSVDPAAIPTVKARIRDLDMAQCRRVSLEMLDVADAATVRDRVAREFPDMAPETMPS